MYFPLSVIWFPCVPVFIPWTFIIVLCFLIISPSSSSSFPSLPFLSFFPLLPRHLTIIHAYIFLRFILLSEVCNFSCCRIVHYACVIATMAFTFILTFTVSLVAALDEGECSWFANQILFLTFMSRAHLWPTDTLRKELALCSAAPEGRWLQSARSATYARRTARSGTMARRRAHVVKAFSSSPTAPAKVRSASRVLCQETA